MRPTHSCRRRCMAHSAPPRTPPSPHVCVRPVSLCARRLGVAGSILCACLAVRLRFITVAAAPWLAQLLGYALVCSNSEVRVPCEGRG